jgi:biotin carboxyl carrier protein
MQNDDIKEKGKPEFKTFVFEETEYKTLLTSKFENRKKWEKPDEKKILSYLPGTLKKLAVKKGDKVEKGDLLLVFEAMKMMNTVKAQQKGKIKEILVKLGDKFPKNTILIEFE